MYIKRTDKTTVGIILFSLLFELFTLVFELFYLPDNHTPDMFFDRVYIYIQIVLFIIIAFGVFSYVTRFTRRAVLFTKYSFLYLFSSFYVVYLILGYIYIDMTYLFLILISLFWYMKFDFLFKYFKHNKEYGEYETFINYYDQTSWLAKHKMIFSVNLFMMVSVFFFMVMMNSLSIINFYLQIETNELGFDKTASFTLLQLVLVGFIFIDYLSEKKKYYYYVMAAVLISYGFYIYTHNIFIPKISELNRFNEYELSFANTPYLWVSVIGGIAILILLLIGFFSSKHTYRKSIHFIAPFFFIFSTILIPFDRSNLEGNASFEYADVWFFSFYNLLIIFNCILLWKNRVEVENIRYYERLNGK